MPATKTIGTGRTGGRDATTGVIAGRYALSVGNPGTQPPTGWRWTPLAEVANLESGHTPSRRVHEYWDGDVPWIGIRDATSNHGRTLMDTEQHVTQLGLDNSSARLLPENTVCLSRTASVGYVVVMGRPMATSQDFVNWVCGPELDHSFLKYVLVSETEALWRFASGTTHQTIYYPEAKAFHVCLPPLPEQRAIASVLGALDDKIDLNRRMCQKLEEMARALFKSWFVDFDPVRAKMEGRDPGLPKEIADLFPSRLVDSELGPIPEGWSAESLDDVADFLNGLALQKYPPQAEFATLPVLKIAQLKRGDTSGADRCSAEVPAPYRVVDGDVIFSWSGSLEVALWTGGVAALNQHLFKVTSDRFPRWCVYQWVCQHLPEFRQIAADKATTMGHIQRRHLSAARVAVPPDAVRRSADSILGPMTDRLLAARSESRNLVALRDTLLPKLISGEVRVPASLGIVVGIKS